MYLYTHIADIAIISLSFYIMFWS